MKTQLLRDESVQPTSGIIAQALGEADEAYCVFLRKIGETPYDFNEEWRYYNDGKAWLCKITFKNKTVLWLSVWNGFFKTSFFFTDKHREDIEMLDIAENIKLNFRNAKNIGRLLPLVVDVKCQSQIDDVLKIADYKKRI
jgi:hypothetical protein